MKRTLALAAIAAIGMAVVGAPPAVSDIQQVTTTIERTGTNPIVAGSDQTTEFTVTTNNPNAVDLQGLVLVILPKGLTPTGFVPDSRASDCTIDDSDPELNSVLCSFANDVSPDARQPFPADGSVVTEVTAKAEPWVTESSFQVCAVTLTNLGSAPTANAPTPICETLASIIPPEWSYDVTDVDISRVSDLVLTATDAGPIAPGSEATVSFNVADNGPSWGFPLTVKFTLPQGLTFTSATEGWTCTAVGQVVTCQISPVSRPTRAAPMTAKLDVTVGTANPARVGSYEIPATVSSDATDPTPADAKATAMVTVAPVQYELKKKASGPYRVGDRVTWELVLSNTGAIDDAGSVTVTDKLPKSLVFKKAFGSGWSCDAVKQTVTCERAGLAAGASSTVKIRTKMVQRGSVTNAASWSSVAYSSGTAKASKKIAVFRSPQTAAALPGTPRRIASGKTDQGKKLRTRVVCRPAKAGAAGEVAFCKVSRAKGVVKVKVLGSQPVRVLVIQTARGTTKYRPFLQRKVYTVKP